MKIGLFADPHYSDKTTPSSNRCHALSYDKINALIIKIQPATLSLSSAQTKEITPLKRDELRAELIRSAV